MKQKPIEPWATHTTHDNPTEHWRVTALLAQSTKRVWDALVELPEEERKKLPESLQVCIPLLYRQLELTDYFLSGIAEGESHATSSNL